MTSFLRWLDVVRVLDFCCLLSRGPLDVFVDLCWSPCEYRPVEVKVLVRESVVLVLLKLQSCCL